ncbi:unnamed protein product [Ophioblennius macclurei]
MAQQAGYPASFKRPTEILRMRRRRSGLESSSSLTDIPGHSVSTPGTIFSPRIPSRVGTKRSNPFAYQESTHSPKKNRMAAADGQRDEKSSTRDCLQLLGSTDKSEEAGYQDLRERSEEAGHQDLRERSEEAGHQDLRERSEEIGHQENIHIKNPGYNASSTWKEYPADWSLKTRLLFTSPLSLSWAEQPRAQEEALGLHHHCRAHFSTLPLSVSDPQSCSELRTAFQQALVYWQHPSLPWLSLFPRINAEKSFNGQNRPWAQDGAVQQSLRREWSLSLSSLYSLLKSRLCPYFYLCSYQFTVLFRAAGLGGSTNITALISPTTRGLREAMKVEGIEFKVPLVKERNKNRRESGEEQEDMHWLKDGADLQNSDGDDEDGSFSWLKEMGVQDKIKTPEGLMMQLQKENHSVSLDHKPESVVLVEGLYTFTLINFLINSKSIIAAAGSQSGLPPTLLSPVAFKGATMHMLKSRCVNVKSQMDFSYNNVSSLEITGPVLPSSLHTITKLLQRAQKGNFWSILSTHIPTAVLNTHSSQLQGGPAQSPVDLSSCGLHPENIQQLLQPSSLEKTALTHIKMSQNRYTWKN